MKKIISLFLVLALSFSMIGTAFAATPSPTTILEDNSTVCTVQAINGDEPLDVKSIEVEMEKFISDTQLLMDVKDFSVSLRSDIALDDYTADEISALLEEDLKQMKEVLSSGYYGLIEKPQTRLANLGGGEYTAEVWAGIPAVGWSTVKQDFKASISSGKVKSITFLGDGYMDGVSWGQYNHIRSWWEDVYGDGTRVDILIKGGINYLFNLVNMNYTATFKEQLKVSGNSLVSLV